MSFVYRPFNGNPCGSASTNPLPSLSIGQELHIPLVNIPQSELVFRGEVTHMLRRLQLSPDEHLTFAPDVPLQQLHDAGL